MVRRAAGRGRKPCRPPAYHMPAAVARGMCRLRRGGQPTARACPSTAWRRLLAAHAGRLKGRRHLLAAWVHPPAQRHRGLPLAALPSAPGPAAASQPAAEHVAPTQVGALGYAAVVEVAAAAAGQAVPAPVPPPPRRPRPNCHRAPAAHRGSEALGAAATPAAAAARVARGVRAALQHPHRRCTAHARLGTPYCCPWQPQSPARRRSVPELRAASLAAAAAALPAASLAAAAATGAAAAAAAAAALPAPSQGPP
eukprot:356155-Chlamydomonas_euryale.AAC.4